MPQRTLKFKIHQDGRVEESVEGFESSSCNEATKLLEDSLGEVKVKKKTAEAFVTDKKLNLTQLNNQSNVSF